MIDFKGSHFEKEIILWGVRWYVAYPFSYRQLEEMMEERGVSVDHATLNRWVLKYAPALENQFRARKRPGRPRRLVLVAALLLAATAWADRGAALSVHHRSWIAIEGPTLGIDVRPR